MNAQKEDWNVIAKTHSGILHHGLFHYLETFKDEFSRLFSVEFKHNKEGRRYALVPLSSERGIERHLSIDATYEHEARKKTPCHLTRVISLENGGMLIQHAYIVLADKTGDASSAFKIYHIDAKRKEASDTEFKPVILNTIESESMQHDVDNLVREKLYELYKHRNQYISERSSVLEDIDTELASYPAFYDNDQLTEHQIKHILTLFMRQKAIYEELYPHEDYPLNSEVVSAVETITSIIKLLNTSLTEHPPVEEMRDETSFKVPRANKSKTKVKSKGASIKKPTDADLTEQAHNILNKLDGCSEAQLCELQADSLILAEYDTTNKSVQKLIAKCDQSIQQKQQYFKTEKEEKLRLIQSAFNDYEKTLAKLQEIHSRHAALVNQENSESEIENDRNDEAYLKTLIPFAATVRQAQRQFIALRLDATNLTPELAHKKSTLLSHSSSLRIFALINNYLKSWVEHALFLGSVETIKYLLVTYPATRMILQNSGPIYSYLMQQILTLTAQNRDTLPPNQQKALKNLIKISYFCFENSNQYQNIFLTYRTKGSPLTVGSIFNHPTPIEREQHISQILFLCALNGHEDVFKLFITLGFQLDQSLYTNASNLFWAEMSQFPELSPRFKKLLEHKMPELVDHHNPQTVSECRSN